MLVIAEVLWNVKVRFRRPWTAWGEGGNRKWNTPRNLTWMLGIKMALNPGNTCLGLSCFVGIDCFQTISSNRFLNSCAISIECHSYWNLWMVGKLPARRGGMYEANNGTFTELRQLRALLRVQVCWGCWRSNRSWARRWNDLNFVFELGFHVFVGISVGPSNSMKWFSPLSARSFDALAYTSLCPYSGGSTFNKRRGGSGKGIASPIAISTNRNQK